jgi:cytochrome c biogenesis protein
MAPIHWVRWAWRLLTSMRTALFLLMLLAVAAVPGSIFPQRSIDAGRVADYLAANPTTGPWLDRLGFFDVFASPWFSAIYLLLIVSLVGCIVPRTRQHVAALRQPPPKAPARLDRLSSYAEGEWTDDRTPEQLLDDASTILSRRGFRVARHDAGSVSAESGYLRETGNLVFHIALCGIVLGVAFGHLYGWRGDVIVPVGSGFASTATTYDSFSPGALVDAEALPPFRLTVDRLDVAFEEQVGTQLGAPRKFEAAVTTVAGPGADPVTEPLNLNAPVTVDGADVFLLGNGYAPVITVTNADGEILYQEATPFLPQDGFYRSVGTVKVTAAAPKQLGLSGLFLPTADPREGAGPVSVFPDLRNPTLVLAVWEGTLFPGGRPQSVYTLTTTEMTPVLGDAGKPLVLRLQPGQKVELPAGRGTVSFDSVVRWAGLSVRHDPGKGATLAAAILTILALLATLLVRRRRVFVRVGPPPGRGSTETPAPVTVVRVGGLSKSADATVDDLVEHLRDELTKRTPTT